MDVSDFLPNGFNLRQGKGGGDPKNGLCFMETVALIAGEKITDHPACACPVLTSYGIWMNDRFDDADRKRLLPLAWATAGTRSKEHEFVRKKILGLAACDIAEMVLPIFEKKHPKDKRPREAINAARAYWADPCDKTLQEARKARASAASAAYASADASSAYAASASASAYASASAAYASASADAADASSAYAAYASADASADASAIRRQIIERQFTALRDAIKAGPNGGLPDEIVIERINAVREDLPVMVRA